MNALGTLRIWLASLRYDLWLDVRGVSGRRRRDLRRELRANLAEAAGVDGVSPALRGVGSLRRLAADGVVPDPTRPRWRTGLWVGSVVAVVLLMATMLASLAWLDGVIAAAPSAEVEGSLTLLPTTSLAYEPMAGGGFGVTFAPGWAWLVTGLLAGLLAAAPWRSLTRRTSATALATENATARTVS